MLNTGSQFFVLKLFSFTLIFVLHYFWQLGGWEIFGSFWWTDAFFCIKYKIIPDASTFEELIGMPCRFCWKLTKLCRRAFCVHVLCWQVWLSFFQKFVSNGSLKLGFSFQYSQGHWISSLSTTFILIDFIKCLSKSLVGSWFSMET